jgi:hypothetical protein
MLHAGDVEVRSVLYKLAELVSALASVHQVVEAAGVFSKGAYIELGLLLYLILDVAHEVTDRGAASTLE